jgi:predicted 3-demethylubiquinone-9 3-methyltransferase (glyoxalase superfamily)
MQKIHPFLWFDTQAEEAAEFYVSLFPNSRITSVARYRPAGPGPEGSAMTVAFELDGQQLVALNGGPHFTFSEAISMVVNCDDQSEVDRLWAALTADGGRESQCGWLKDRYGLSWQIVPKRLMELAQDKDPGRATRTMQAMMKMVKLDIAALERAADGG